MVNTRLIGGSSLAAVTGEGSLFYRPTWIHACRRRGQRRIIVAKVWSAGGGGKHSRRFDLMGKFGAELVARTYVHPLLHLLAWVCPSFVGGVDRRRMAMNRTARERLPRPFMAMGPASSVRTHTRPCSPAYVLYASHCVTSHRGLKYPACVRARRHHLADCRPRRYGSEHDRGAAAMIGT